MQCCSFDNVWNVIKICHFQKLVETRLKDSSFSFFIRRWRKRGRRRTFGIAKAFWWREVLRCGKRQTGLPCQRTDGADVEEHTAVFTDKNSFPNCAYVVNSWKPQRFFEPSSLKTWGIPNKRLRRKCRESSPIPLSLAKCFHSFSWKSVNLLSKTWYQKSN